jgi:hypothetical protein
MEGLRTFRESTNQKAVTEGLVPPESKYRCRKRSIVRGSANKRVACQGTDPGDLRSTVGHAKIDVEPAILVDEIKKRDRKPPGADRIRAEIDDFAVFSRQPHDHFAIIHGTKTHRADKADNAFLCEIQRRWPPVVEEGMGV